MKSFEECIWRQAVIEAHQLLLEQAMLEDLVCYSGTEAFQRIAWDLHIALDIELTAAGELLLPVSQAVYQRACDASARGQGREVSDG